MRGRWLYYGFSNIIGDKDTGCGLSVQLPNSWHIMRGKTASHTSESTDSQKCSVKILIKNAL